MCLLMSILWNLLYGVSATNSSQNNNSNHIAYLYLPQTSCTMYFDSAQNIQIIFFNCSSPSLSSSSWQTCFTQCCRGLDYQDYTVPNNDAIRMCRAANPEEDASQVYILKISLIVGFSLLALVIFIIVCTCKKKCPMNNGSVHQLIGSLKLK